MRATPNQMPALADIVGRDDLVADLRGEVQRSSLVLLAERRVGKTTVLRKLDDALSGAGCLCLRQDLEGCGGVREFAERVARAATERLKGLPRWRGQALGLVDRLGGAQAGGWALGGGLRRTWQTVLDSAVTDLLDAHKTGLVALLWDEFPMMLQGFGQPADPGDGAGALLDHLRALRQRHPRLRLVLTGSIGLHHVLRPIGKTASINDIEPREVPPLALPNAVDLARRLLTGESFAAARAADVAEAIALGADCVPYYIHHLVKALLARREQPLDAAAVADARRRCLRDAADPWHLTHFEERLGTYYGDRAPHARRVLEAVAESVGPVAHEAIEARLRQTGDTVDLPELLRDLVVDHYLRADDGSRAYAFRFGVVRDWWRWRIGCDE